MSAVAGAGSSGAGPLSMPTGRRAAPAPPPPTVEVVTVTTQTVTDEPTFIGQTEAFRPVEIRSQVTGIIKQVYFTEGRNVKKAIDCISSTPCRLKGTISAPKPR